MHREQRTLYCRYVQLALTHLLQHAGSTLDQDSSRILKTPGHQDDLLNALTQEILETCLHIAHSNRLNRRHGA